MTPPPVSGLAAELQGILERAVVGGITPSASCAVVSNGVPLPVITAGDAVPSTYFDLASVTKVFTAITALSLVDSGILDLDEPVSAWLEPYANGGKSAVTLRHLLTHTSGLHGTWDGWRTALAAGAGFNRAALLDDLLSTDLAAPAGTRFEYSCVGYNTVMALAERATGLPWAQLVTERVLHPVSEQQPGTGVLELTGTPEAARCAPTEFQPEYGRGMVCGVVHDEAAWSLGGLCGNAGMFGTAEALAIFGEVVRTGLADILSPALAAEMWQDQLPAVLGSNLESGGPGYGHGLGLRIGQETWMGAHFQARGHNGFTGTSLLMDKESGITAVLLTNRVHPSRTLSDVTELRHTISDAIYTAAGH
ncbi:serine hydrolase [Arthrobacter sp. GMC3]|uniref:serine hydrolase domain-containing protein n=1 Tax=Arthrobacter sp. GMC3 TaxID=2058894 RepID=UPI0015E36A55|nr:serine hydrolase domain-containing protein [Arthrobacter sp. GMC3]